jgi:hypothetical protein
MNEKEFRDGVMPRAQLSMMASQLAVDKTTQKMQRNLQVLN